MDLASKTISDMQRFAKKERVGKLLVMITDNGGITLMRLRAKFARNQGVALETVDKYITELRDNEEIYIEFDGVEHFVWELNAWLVEEVKRKEDRRRATEEIRKKQDRMAVAPLTTFMESGQKIGV